MKEILYYGLGTADNGLDKLNINTFSVTNFSYNNKDTYSIASKNITGIKADDKNIWISLWNGYDGALNKLDKKTNKFVKCKIGTDFYCTMFLLIKKIIFGH